MSVSQLRLGTGDIYLDVPAGSVDGTFAVNKFGGGIEAAADTITDVWDNGVTNPIYDFPTTATITHVRSAVDSATTQGLVVEVQGLDANWDLTVQSATLDGTNSTTEVALTTPLIRVFRIKVTDSVVADQNIWVGATGMVVGTVSAVVVAGNNQTLMAIYTVPADHTAYMTGFYTSVVDSTNKTPKSTKVAMWFADRANGYEFQLKMATGIAEGGSSEHHMFAPYYKIGEKTDVKIQVTCDSQPGLVYSGFDLTVVANA